MKKRLSLTAIFICLILMNTMTVFAASDYDGGSGISIGLCIIIGLIVAFGLCALFRVPEMRLVFDLVGKVTRRLKRG